MVRFFVPVSTVHQLATKGYWLNFFLRRARYERLMKGKALSSSNRSTTRQKPDDTFALSKKQAGVKRAAAKRVKFKTRYSFSASDGCSTSRMKPGKSARLTHPDIKTLFDPEASHDIQETDPHRNLALPKSRSAKSRKDCSVALNSFRTCRNQVVEDIGCIAQGFDVLLMVVHQHSHRAHLGIILTLVPVPTHRNVANWIP